jgi:hypothetical protein
MQKTKDIITLNALHIRQDIRWMQEVLKGRFAWQNNGDGKTQNIFEITPPQLENGRSMYSDLIYHYGMELPERLAFIMALVPHIDPAVLDVFFRSNKITGRGFTEYGGIQGKKHGGFIPTGETVIFTLAGNNIEDRLRMMAIFDRDHYFARHNILKLDPPPQDEPLLSGTLTVSKEIIDLVTSGEVHKPDFSREFPAKLISTEMEWDELVLSPQTMEQVRETLVWIEHEKTLMEDWGLKRKLKPGYKCLFHGPSGTGKTLTASLLGKEVGKDVYRIDLSAVISKYIGETEKNLERIFDKAEHLDCILFFDEADALFGKRTNVSDAHDRYANQEVSYLLQRIEDFPGLVILASNFRSNIDESFMRRFQAIIHFPMPDSEDRHRLWNQSFSKRSELASEVDLGKISKDYKISGGSIMNVVRFASLMTINRGDNIIRNEDLMIGLRREYQKEGKTL